MKNKKEFGAMVRAARRTQKITQAELAKRMKTKQPSVARAEQYGCEISFAERAMQAMGLRLAFHHISFGTKEQYQTWFLGGM